MISVIPSLCVFTLLVAFIGVRLRAVGYAWALSATLLFMLALQLLTALTAASLSALALALVLSLVAASAGSLARAQTARRVVTLGASLAATQIVSPVGVIVTAILAPALAFLRSSGETRFRNAGLLVLLLFIPVAAALLLAYLANMFRFDFAVLMNGPFDHILSARVFDPESPRVNGAINALALIVIAFPVWFVAAFHRQARIVATVTSALLIAVVMMALLQRSHSLGAFAPSLAGLSYLALAEAGPEAMLPEQAVLFAAFSAIVSWLFIAVPV
ncbi:MAG TPA: hypothetical protein VIM56_14155 [Rhizomicrobium sp.]